ncbi:MAG TPA: hypothetical protein VHU22_24105 [Xanthobacteraceae bacterium]|nr:hypothetical protein [Xanthobacteraceae bacterium]
MSRVEELRAQVQKLYEQADRTEDREQRFEIILKAMMLESEADCLEREDVRPPSQAGRGQQVAQQQQQPQPDDDKKK